MWHGGQDQIRPSEFDLRFQNRECNAIGMIRHDEEGVLKALGLSLVNNALYNVNAIKA